MIPMPSIIRPPLFFVCAFLTALIIGACSSTESISEDSKDNSNAEEKIDSSGLVAEENPFISGHIEVIKVGALGDTIRTPLNDATLRVSTTEGISLKTSETNINGEFQIELDAFRPDSLYDLFIYSSEHRIMRNIRFVYEIRGTKNIPMTLDYSGRTEMNIDYLDLNTGEGRGSLITND